jgi:uncharacterized repeat protein (TIGR03806 family)
MNRLRPIALGLLALALGVIGRWTSEAADPARRVPWIQSRVLGTPDPPLPYTTKPYLPQLGLKNPLFVIAEPGTSNLLVVLQGGEPERPSRVLRIPVADPNPRPEPVLELPGFLLYAVAFHPGYITNRQLFTFANGPTGHDERTNRISRWKIPFDPSPPVAPDSGQILLEWRSAGHDGGGLDFGPDGMLYLATGDGSSDSDAWNSGQSLDDLLGAVLRIDVDRPGPDRRYSIPQDNPFRNHPGARGEIWAYGLRNPWRLAIDPPTGQVWVGNNGQDLWESIHLVRPGENYGWSVFEGSHVFYRNRPRGPTPIVAPTFEHPHSEARSLTGGVVYRGSRLPELQGVYLYGDHATGRIWGGRHDGTRVTEHRELAATPLQITSFGMSPTGELLITDLGSGLHRLVPFPPQRQRPAFPRRLSETGLFTSTPDGTPAPGVIPYVVNAPGWVDGAAGDRLLALPGDSRIQYTSSRAWGLPEGTVLAQTLGFPASSDPGAPIRRVETRLLTLQDGRWAGYSYRWQDDQSDAVLVPAEGQDADLRLPDPHAPSATRSQRWRFPSRSECLACHSRAAGFVLGVTELQMNRDPGIPGAPRDNQLELFQDLSLFTGPLPKPAAELGRLANPYNPTALLEDRARSYLHANCSVCHIEAGGGNARMHLEFTTPAERMELIGARPQHDTFGLRDAMLVAPGHPDHSVLLHRLSTRGRGQMPPLVSTVVDTAAVALFRNWIASLPSGPAPQHDWTLADLQPDLPQTRRGRSFDAGRTAFRDTGCLQCHRMGSDGGNVGPDLTGVGTRLSSEALLEAILVPSRTIAPEYAQTEIETAGGETWIGRVESETDTVLMFRAAGADDAVSLTPAQIRSRRLSTVSNMPEGMVNTLEKSQILDLLAYLLSGGDPGHPAFRPEHLSP